MWRPHVLRQMVRPRVGDSIIVHGNIDYYSRQGRLQLIADVFEHQGQGILALEMERLRQKLVTRLFPELAFRATRRFLPRAFPILVDPYFQCVLDRSSRQQTRLRAQPQQIG